MTGIGAEKTEPSGPPPYPSRPDFVKFDAQTQLEAKVNETLFKVWDGSFLRHSEFFQAVTSLLDIDTAAEGSDGEHPLILDGVQVADFERLLWIIYPPVIGEFRAKTTQDWVAILDLSTRWKFRDIRKLSIKELAKLEIDPVEKIELMLKYEVKQQWAYSAFIALCSRADGLDVSEGQKLGVEPVIKIALVREKLEKWGRKKPDEVRKAVCEVLGLELEGGPLPPK
ncbi:hypothetical protein FPV67DRAFT_1668243 [Lyophyllum atratum]|nr:hypothetical protein FPV67DRAFT_1668243 [Lyophyllum atratum]